MGHHLVRSRLEDLGRFSWRRGRSKAASSWVFGGRAGEISLLVPYSLPAVLAQLERLVNGTSKPFARESSRGKGSEGGNGR